MKTKVAYWEHFSHQSDIGVRGVGETLGEAFAQAATALTAVVTDPHLVKPLERIEIVCEAPTLGQLLVNWLNAVVFEMATRHMLFGQFDSYVCPQELGGAFELEAILWGEGIDVARHQPAVEVKGATYSELRVTQDDEGNWIAQCVVDV